MLPKCLRTSRLVKLRKKAESKKHPAALAEAPNWGNCETEFPLDCRTGASRSDSTFRCRLNRRARARLNTARFVRGYYSTEKCI